ncbi:MAG: glycosyltransferase family 9 protein [Candidatus Woesearchaeota archaeon]|nr:MAG: glycosyltransferase family 9 protein [Candidatus Woesearchaeota archaeon]
MPSTFTSRAVRAIELCVGGYYHLHKQQDVSYASFKRIALLLTSPLGIGDLLMDTPFLATLRKELPNATIELITDKQIFEQIDEVDAIHSIKGNTFALRKQCKTLAKRNYDLVVVMNRAINQTFLAQALAPRHLLGYLGGFTVQATFKLKKEQLAFTKQEPYRNMALHLAEALDLKTTTTLIKPKFSSKTVSRVSAFYKKLSLDRNKKTLLVNAYTLWESRNWAKESYVQLLAKLHAKVNIVLFGGPDAKDTNEYIKIALAKKGITAYDVAGKLTLPEAMYFTSLVDVLLTSDSGPMHFALMMRTPTLALFGPTNPMWYLPEGFENDRTIDYVWYADYKPCKMYNYESKLIDASLAGLHAIPLLAVEKKLRTFLKTGGFS